jgi:acyl-CoA hydrolase
MFAIKKDRKGKRISESAIDGRRIKLFYEKINPLNIIFGGRILEIVNSYASLVAEKHAEVKCKTSGIDFVRFFSLAKMGDILVCFVSVNRAWEFSMEVGVKVIAEDFRSLEQKHILSAYFTFETIGKEREIAYVICETKKQKRRYVKARERKNFREK